MYLMPVGHICYGKLLHLYSSVTTILSNLKWDTLQRRRNSSLFIQQGNYRMRRKFVVHKILQILWQAVKLIHEN